MLNIICHQGNVNQNHEISFYTSQNGYDLKKKKRISVGKVVEKLNIFWVFIDIRYVNLISIKLWPKICMIYSDVSSFLVLLSTFSLCSCLVLPGGYQFSRNHVWKVFLCFLYHAYLGLPWWLSSKESTCNAGVCLQCRRPPATQETQVQSLG